MRVTCQSGCPLPSGRACGEGKDRPPPLEDVVHGFIHALNEPELAEKMRRVLRTGKFVLLVDGI